MWLQPVGWQRNLLGCQALKESWSSAARMRPEMHSINIRRAPENSPPRHVQAKVDGQACRESCDTTMGMRSGAHSVSWGRPQKGGHWVQARSARPDLQETACTGAQLGQASLNAAPTPTHTKKQEQEKAKCKIQNQEETPSSSSSILHWWKASQHIHCKDMLKEDFSDGPVVPVVRNPPANADNMGSIPGPGRSHMPQGS